MKTTTTTTALPATAAAAAIDTLEDNYVPPAPVAPATHVALRRKRTATCPTHGLTMTYVKATATGDLHRCPKKDCTHTDTLRSGWR